MTVINVLTLVSVHMCLAIKKNNFQPMCMSMCTVWSKLCSTKFSCVVQYEYEQEDLSWCIWMWCFSKHKGKEETELNNAR